MQLIPVLTVEDDKAALDFYLDVFNAQVGRSLYNTTQIIIQGQSIAIRKSDEDHPIEGDANVVLMVETAAPDVLEQAALKLGATTINPVDGQDSGIRAGSIRDPFGFQWILSTPIPR